MGGCSGSSRAEAGPHAPPDGRQKGLAVQAAGGGGRSGRHSVGALLLLLLLLQLLQEVAVDLAGRGADAGVCSGSAERGGRAEWWAERVATAMVRAGHQAAAGGASTDLHAPGKAAPPAAAPRCAAAAAWAPAAPGCAATCRRRGWGSAAAWQAGRPVVAAASPPWAARRHTGTQVQRSAPSSSPPPHLSVVSCAAGSSRRCSSCSARMRAIWLTLAPPPLVCTSSKNSCSRAGPAGGRPAGSLAAGQAGRRRSAGWEDASCCAQLAHRHPRRGHGDTHTHTYSRTHTCSSLVHAERISALPSLSMPSRPGSRLGRCAASSTSGRLSSRLRGSRGWEGCEKTRWGDQPSTPACGWHGASAGPPPPPPPPPPPQQQRLPPT